MGEELWVVALGNNFGQLSGTNLPMNCFEEQQFWGAAFGGSFKGNFGEQLSVATSRFAEWLLGAVLVNRFAESPVLGQQLWGGNFFRTRLLVATLGNNYGEQFCGFVVTLTNF